MEQQRMLLQSEKKARSKTTLQDEWTKDSRDSEYNNQKDFMLATNDNFNRSMGTIDVARETKYKPVTAQLNRRRKTEEGGYARRKGDLIVKQPKQSPLVSYVESRAAYENLKQTSIENNFDTQNLKLMSLNKP